MYEYLAQIPRKCLSPCVHSSVNLDTNSPYTPLVQISIHTPNEPPSPVPISNWYNSGEAAASETEILVLALLMVRAHDEVRLEGWIGEALTEDEAYTEV